MGHTIVPKHVRYTPLINLKKNQLDVQFIFSTFRQTPLHVSRVFTGTVLSWLGPTQPGQQIVI